MYDQCLMNKATSSSSIIRSIDTSYQVYIQKLKAQQLHVPFADDLKMIKKEHILYVLGVEDILEIRKLVFRQKSYQFIFPLFEKVGIYAKYEKGQNFTGWAISPPFTCHLISSEDPADLCLNGNFEVPPSNFQELQAQAKSILKMLEVTNLESLGTHPPDHPVLRMIFELNEEQNKEALLKTLLGSIITKENILETQDGIVS